MAHKAPGKSYRKGLSLVDIIKMFPTTRPRNSGSSRPGGPMVRVARTATATAYSIRSPIAP